MSAQDESVSQTTSSQPQMQGKDPQAPPGKPQWIFWAITSGSVAACNGVFAKLTTTAQTENLAASLSHTLGYTDSSRFVELVVRGLFFTCNLLSNALMWILFTRALTAANSTTRVSVLNTSANFMVTAVLGMAVFSEGLPLAWWGGAVMLLTGSVIIGRRDEEGKETKADGVALGERQSIDQAQAKDVGSTGGASDSEIYKDDSNEDNERSQRNQKRFRDEI